MLLVLLALVLALLVVIVIAVIVVIIIIVSHHSDRSEVRIEDIRALSWGSSCGPHIHHFMQGRDSLENVSPPDC